MTYKLPTNWSPQQSDFINWCVEDDGNGCLVAVAGSGKTTTLLGGASAMLKSGKVRNIAICAYNKKIGDEIKQKALDLGFDWKQINAGTVHSFGFAALKKT